MAQGGTINITTEVWQKKLAEYTAATGKNMREALYEEWPLLIRKVMDFTPPFVTRNARSANSISNSVSDLAIGRAAVAFDIYKTMRPFDPAQVRSKRLKQIIENQDVEAFNAIAAKSKNQFLQGATAIRFSPNEHLRQRNARGRVTGKSRNKVVLGADAILLKNYVSKVQSRVGYAKSGWLKALQLVGGNAPAYVTRQGTNGGTVIDDHAADNPSITAINRTPWAIRQDEGKRILADAHLSRINAIIAKIKTKERLAAKAAKLAA